MFNSVIITNFQYFTIHISVYRFKPATRPVSHTQIKILSINMITTISFMLECILTVHIFPFLVLYNIYCIIQRSTINPIVSIQDSGV